MKTAVVTGGLGFIGSNLIRILSNNGYFVINIDKVSYASSFRNISENIKNYRFYKLNINNQNKVYEILCQELSSKIIQSFFNPTFSVKYVKSVAKKP